MIIKNNWEDKDVLQHTDMNTLASGITSINVYNEDWTLLCDSTRTEFPDNDMSYEPGTLRVYANGLRKRRYPGGNASTGGYDYEEVLASAVQGTKFKFYSPPAATVKLVVDYQKANI